MRAVRVRVCVCVCRGQRARQAAWTGGGSPAGLGGLFAALHAPARSLFAWSSCWPVSFLGREPGFI